MDKSVALILEYAQELTKQNVVGKGDCISVKSGAYLYASKKEVSLADLKEDDVLKIKLDEATGEYALHARIYAAKQDVSAICHCHPKWVEPIAACAVDIPAVSDDMTQIIGRNCRTSKNNPTMIVANLLRRNSTLVEGDGCITTGRTLNEAYTCVLVLDKAAHCFVGSAVVKKNVCISPFEAVLMNTIYKLKYSKKNQENLQSEEGNA
ncbi:MAG: class II aldolase/adducin family protein [Clostridia bacterium]|nr:class II aldolase/adducin family protein [Clostridia bacterium]